MSENKQAQYNNPVLAVFTGIRDLFRKQIPSGELRENDRLDGKTVLVDGSSSGLGFAIALDCARRGATIIMACRSGIPGKGEQVKQLSRNPNVHMLPVDFSDYNSILHLAYSIRDQFAPIDIYICNAGIVPKKSRTTPQGLEEMFMVNYFSKFIFVNLLVENNCFSDPASRIPRIIFIASESHRNPKQFEWEKFGIYEPYSIGKSMELYGYYKLLLTTYARELSRRLNPVSQTRFSIFALCPGPVNSNIAREAPKIFHPLIKLVFGIFFKSPQKAAIPAVYLAASGDQEGKAWDYFFLMSRKEADEKANDPANGQKVWQLSETMQKKLMADHSPFDKKFNP